MNRLLFLFPAEPNLWAGALDFSCKLCKFLDHEEFRGYWDEKLYKKFRGKIEGADARSQGLRRLKVHDVFTDYSYLPSLPEGTSVYYRGEDYSQTIYGRFVAAIGDTEFATGIVKTSSEKLPGQMSVWKDNVQHKPVSLKPFIDDFVSANEWFAQRRKPQRVFNADADKHGRKEYEVDGLTVSALDLPPDEIDYALSHAVGAKGERRLAHYHQVRDIIVIFSYENRKDATDAPVYHGHQFGADNQKQLNRLPAELLRKLSQLGL